MNAEPKTDRPYTVLLVDDEQMLLEVSEKMLKRLGYKVVAAGNGREALEAFHAEPHRFDLVLTDEIMPDMAGRELAKELLQIRPDVPIIVLTGYSPHVTQETAERMGFRAFAMKPLCLKELDDLILRVLKEREPTTTGS